ncbi:MAG: hypothetical protein RLZZ385_2830 [Pseudomonadota bacterium]
MNAVNPGIRVAAFMFFGASGMLFVLNGYGQERDQTPALLAMLDDENGPVMVVAHRACWKDGAPENSLAAIERCLELNVDMIEIDVAITADGVPVLLHDETLDRTTDGSGPVKSLAWSQVRGLKLRAGAGGEAALMTDQGIPTLQDALELARGRILINLDVKGEVFDPAFEIVEAVGVEDQILMKMNALPGTPALDSARFLGKTLFMPVIRECSADVDPRSCAPILSAVIPEYGRYMPIAYEITFVNQPYFSEGVSAMDAAGGRIWVNALEPRHAAGLRDELALSDPDGNWGRIVELGADIIQTDYPDALIEYLQAKGLRE